MDSDRDLIKDALRRAINTPDGEMAYNAAMKLAEMLAEDREAAKRDAMAEMDRQAAEIHAGLDEHFRFNFPYQMRSVPL